MILGPIPGHESVTADETNETKHNIRRKNFVPIKITYGFVKPPKTSSDPDGMPPSGSFCIWGWGQEPPRRHERVTARNVRHPYPELLS